MQRYETEIGFLDVENIKYLLDQGVLVKSKEGVVIRSHERHSSYLDRDIQIWSMYRWVFEDIRTVTGVTDMNAVLDIMRKGDAKYPQVTNIFTSGERICQTAKSKRKGEGKANKKKF